MSEYLSAADAARHLGCSESLIRSRISSGTLTAKKVLGKWQIRMDDLDRQPRAHEGSQPDLTIAEPHDRNGTEPHDRNGAVAQRRDPATAHDRNAVEVTPAWRDDLLAQVSRLEADAAQREADKEKMRDDFDVRLAEQRQESGLLVESAKARIIDLERELTVRDSRIVDLQAKQESTVAELRGQVAVLEAKVREILEKGQDILEKGQDEALQLANRIADLVDRQQEAEARIHELAPVAEQVPMLQAAVEEKDASLSEREQALREREQELGNMRQDIDAIASRRVTGPVFRLLTKGRLRR